MRKLDSHLCRARALALRTCLPLATAVSAVALTCAGATPAQAWSNVHGKVYVLEVVEGENTVPQFGAVAKTLARTEGNDPQPQIAVSIIKNGTTVYKEEGRGWAQLPQVPQVGETVQLESPVGHVIGSAVYDGNPTIDPSTCVGSTTFEGNNTSGYTVEGSYIIDSLVTPYRKSTELKQSGFEQAQVKSLTGTNFGGSFLQPVPAGATVSAQESLKTQLSGEETFLYSSERDEPANQSCPSAPPPPPPPPLVTPLQGALAGVHHITIRRILKSGWRDQVTINQAGTIIQDLYLRGGKLPAVAASSHKHKTPPAVLLARGVATAGGSGTVNMVLKLTKVGRHKLKSSGRLNAILLTTLHTANGQIDTLSPHSLTLTR